MKFWITTTYKLLIYKKNIGEDIQNTSKDTNKNHNYPIPSKKKEIIEDATRIFEELAKEEDMQERKNNILNEIL